MHRRIPMLLREYFLDLAGNISALVFLLIFGALFLTSENFT